MTTTLPLHLIDLEHLAAVLSLSLQGLRAAWASNAVARVDFDAVVHSAEKLRSHLEGVRIECEYAEGRTPMNDRLVGALAFWAFLATFGWLTACDTLQTERRQVSQWYDAHVCVPKGGR